MAIKLLSETLINQIAAGEVVERPASVIKELVENAIDAGATRVEIATAGGGKTLMRVTDNGVGMDEADLAMAVRRHCTSKIVDHLDDIRSLGFRGEALPSIGSVAKMRIVSRQAKAEFGTEIAVLGGDVRGPRPAAANPGTAVEVRDLFHATPARLKFLKTERAEAAAITEVVRRIALAFPSVRFTLSGPDRQTLDLPAGDRLGRIAQVLGREFPENAIALDAMREGVVLTGHAGLPTFNRGNALHQYAYVNGRPVQDKLIASALRGAYAETMPRGRHPVAVIEIALEPALVDVNVHPAKSDVRFRDPGLVRGLIVGAIRQALAAEGDRASTTASAAMMNAFASGRPDGNAGSFAGTFGGHRQSGRPGGYDPSASPYRPFADAAGPTGFSERAQAPFDAVVTPSARLDAPAEAIREDVQHRLGAARAQLHANYIVSQTTDGLVIVDQHAAHERLVFEAMRKALDTGRLASQVLLIPEIVDLPEEDCDRLMPHAETFARLGLAIERFGPGAIAVRETPAMLGEVDAAAMVRELADTLAETDEAGGLRTKLEHVAATMACYGSVRSGRTLRADEMNALLRQMEATPGSGQCNHGRPTYIELKLSDIERLFGRR